MHQAPRDRVERAALNQSLFREVNERVDEVTGASDSMLRQLLCECANQDCVAEVSLTKEEYEAVRRWPNHFVVKPGHVYTDFERVVDGEGERYDVVEKFGKAGEVALELDSRRAPS
jgi:hypothetical protein